MIIYTQQNISKHVNYNNYTTSKKYMPASGAYILTYIS